MKNKGAVAVYDWALEVSLWGVIFFLTFSKAGVEIWFHLGLFFWVLKRSLLGRRLFRSKHSIKDFFSGFRFAPSQLNLCIYVMALVFFLSAFFSFDKRLSFEGIFGKLYTYLFVFFLTLEVITRYNPLQAKEVTVSREVLFRILGVFLFSIVVINIDGLWQFATGKDFMRGYEPTMQKDIPRLRASFQSPNNFAAWLITVLPIVIASIFVRFRRFFMPLRILIKALLVASFISSLFLMARTFSRGAWLGFAVSMVFISIFGYMYSTRKLKLFATLGIFVLAASISLAFMVQPLSERLLTLKQGFDKAGFRRYNWREAAAIIKDYPVLGAGPNTYTAIGPKYKLRKRGGIYPHNSYLHFAAEVGLLGIGAFLWFLYRFFALGIGQLKARKDIMLLGILGGVMAILVQSFFDTTFYSLQLNMFLWFMFGLAVSLTQRRQPYS
jgi:putative inorganic carbon (HCO3(-)) transporter